MKKRIIKSLLLTFIITCMQPLLYAQSGSKVSGVVTDSDKEPMIGVVVQVKNTNVASVTNTEGKYSLNVPKGKTTLVFSYLGYTTLERQIKGATLNVEMQDEVNELDEVVVVGYHRRVNQRTEFSERTRCHARTDSGVVNSNRVRRPGRRSRSTRTRNSNLRGRRRSPICGRWHHY